MTTTDQAMFGFFLSAMTVNLFFIAFRLRRIVELLERRKP
jgi:hypothetical protein